MTLQWIRKNYRVPAKRGGRVEYTGEGRIELGTICGAAGSHLRVRLDRNPNHSLPFHPTWKLRYLTDKCPRCDGTGRVWDIAGDQIAAFYGHAGGTMRTVFRCDDCHGEGKVPTSTAAQNPPSTIAQNGKRQVNQGASQGRPRP